MKQTEDDQFRLLVKYVNAGADLAEQVERDLAKGDKISMATTERLVKFKKAAIAAAGLINRFMDAEEQFEN